MYRNILIGEGMHFSGSESDDFGNPFHETAKGKDKSVRYSLRACSADNPGDGASRHR